MNVEFKKMIINAIQEDPVFAKTLAGAICNNLSVDSDSIALNMFGSYAVEQDTIEINSGYGFDINITEKLKVLNISDVSKEDVRNLEFFIRFLYESYQTYITKEEVFNIIKFLLEVKGLKDGELKSFVFGKKVEIIHNEITTKDFLESVNVEVASYKI